jgi:hypothetical protein
VFCITGFIVIFIMNQLHISCFGHYQFRTAQISRSKSYVQKAPRLFTTCQNKALIYWLTGVPEASTGEQTQRLGKWVDFPFCSFGGQVRSSVQVFHNHRWLTPTHLCHSLSNHRMECSGYTVKSYVQQCELFIS